MIEVILLERVERLGGLGEVVKVRPGYARNYLLPEKKALRATKSNLEFFEKRRAELEAHNAKQRGDAEAQGKKIAGLKVMLIRQASETGQLYGSVTARDIAEAAAEAGQKIERRMVEIKQPIKTLGLFGVHVKLHPEVSVDITVNVARTEEEARVQVQKAAAAASKAEAEAVPAVLATEGEATDEAKPAKKPRAKKAKAAKEEESAA